MDQFTSYGMDTLAGQSVTSGVIHRCTMDSVSNLAVYDPFQKRNIGRRTGKVIPLKNGPINSVEDFFSDSEPDLTLNITKQTDEVKSSDKDLSSPSADEVLPQTTSARPVKQDYAEIPDADTAGVINPFNGTRYGRRTGKDVLAGKKKLIQSNGVGNFSDFFTDSDASYSLNPTPSRSPAVSSSISSPKQSDHDGDASSQGSISQDRQNISKPRKSPRKSIHQKNKSLQEEKENNLSQLAAAGSLQSRASRKSSALHCNTLEVDVHIAQNSSKVHSQSLMQKSEEQTSQRNESSSFKGKSKDTSSILSDENSSESEKINSRQSEENDCHPECETKGKERTLEATIDVETLTDYESDDRLSQSGKWKTTNVKKKSQDTDSNSSESSDFKAPHPRETTSKQSAPSIDSTDSHDVQENENEDPIACVKPKTSKPKADKAKALTPSKSTTSGSDLDFGGDVTGSVSQADKFAGKQFFGIKKRLTFSKDAQEQILPSTPPGVSSAEEMNEEDENCDDFVIVENDEIVTCLSMTDEAKFSQKSVQKKRKSSFSSRRSVKHSQRKSEPLKDNTLHETPVSHKQKARTHVNPVSNSQINAKQRTSIAKENLDISGVAYEEEIYNIEYENIKSTKTRNNMNTLEHKMNAQNNSYVIPFEDKERTADHQCAEIVNKKNERLNCKNKRQNLKDTKSTKKVDIPSSIRNKRNLCQRPRAGKNENTLSVRDNKESKSEINKLKDNQKDLHVSINKSQRRNLREKHVRALKKVKKLSPEVENDPSSPEKQIDGNESSPVLPSKDNEQGAGLESATNSADRPWELNKRQRRQHQPVQYPCEEAFKRRKRSNGDTTSPMTKANQTPLEQVPVQRKCSKSLNSASKEVEGKSSPLKQHNKQLRKSTLRKSPDRRRTLSRKSLVKKKAISTGRSQDTESNTTVSTPTPLHPMMMLPRVTPKSGVSFRSRSSYFAFLEKENHDTSDYQETEENMTASDHIKPVASRQLPTKEVSTLRKKAIMNSAKGKRQIKDCLDEPAYFTGQDGESTTILPSPSTSPVHYLETTASQRRSSIFQLPDYSNKIVPPEKAENGLRRSQRTKVKRLNHNMGEGIVYRRDSTGFGLLVDSIQTSSGAIQFFQREKERKKKQRKRKFAMKTVPAKIKRLSSHWNNEESFTDSSEIPVINPETDETVNIELVARSSTASWFGPDLDPVSTVDPVAACLLLNQPFFGTGELQIRPFSAKEQQVAVYTLIYSVISGKISVTINDVSFVVQTGDDFFIPRGSQYRLQNLRKDIAKIKFLNLKDHENNHQTSSFLPL